MEFSVPFDHLKHRFIDLDEVAFWVCQKADNPVAGCVENLKHRLINFTKVVFCGGQQAGNESSRLFDQ
jgi:hypothetical protein